jgi:hypothetical protein
MTVSASSLNEALIRFLEIDHPEWGCRIERRPDADAQEDYIIATVPDPPGLHHRIPLSLSTWGGEVTVAFDAMHMHVPWPETYRQTDWRDDVTAYVQGFMSEDLIVASVVAEGRVRSISTLHPPSLGRYPRHADGDRTIHVCSWRGTYDETFRCDWQAYLDASDP